MTLNQTHIEVLRWLANGCPHPTLKLGGGIIEVLQKYQLIDSNTAKITDKGSAVLASLTRIEYNNGKKIIKLI